MPRRKEGRFKDDELVRQPVKDATKSWGWCLASSKSCRLCVEYKTALALGACSNEWPE